MIFYEPFIVELQSFKMQQSKPNIDKIFRYTYKIVIKKKKKHKLRKKDNILYHNQNE